MPPFAGDVRPWDLASGNGILRDGLAEVGIVSRSLRHSSDARDRVFTCAGPPDSLIISGELPQLHASP